MPLSPDFKRAILAQTTGERDVVLFTITHPRWTDTLRLSTDQTVQNGEDPETAEPIWGTWSRGEFYRHLPISPTMPSSSDEEAPAGSVSISNVGNAVSPYLQIVDSTYPRVTVEVVMSSTPDIVEQCWPELDLTQASWDQMLADITFGMDTANREPCPWLRFVPAYFYNLTS